MYCVLFKPVDVAFFLLVANKVALLIGNKDYDEFQQLGKLFHPINDACDLTGRLVNMGFKVSC